MPPSLTIRARSIDDVDDPFQLIESTPLSSYDINVVSISEIYTRLKFCLTDSGNTLYIYSVDKGTNQYNLIKRSNTKMNLAYDKLNPLLLNVGFSFTSPLSNGGVGAKCFIKNINVQGINNTLISSSSSFSGEGFVEVDKQPSILRNPIGGNSFKMLSTLVVGSEPITYQWYKDNILIEGATSSYHYAGSFGTYKLVATNFMGSVTSNEAEINTGTIPVITTQPIGGVSPIYLSVIADGTRPITYQWYKDNLPIPSSDTSSILASVGGNYYVTVSNYIGSVNSNSIIVTTP
jgi:hypothetical protein